MKELIIFGRSCFINRLNLANIDYDKCDICCINKPIEGLKRVDYLVSADEWVKPEIPEGCEWVSVNNGWEIIKTEKVIRAEQRLSWKHYSSDLAVNFAILRGYKTIYLAGIDLVEDNKPFNHYDGIINNYSAPADGCKDEKEHIKMLAREADVKLYQLNPDCDWLEFRDLNLLMGSVHNPPR